MLQQDSIHLGVGGDNLSRTLYGIAVDPALSFDEQMTRVLKVGCREFQMEVGVFARIEADLYQVLHVEAPDTFSLSPGCVFPLDDAFCRLALDAEHPVGFGRPGEAESSSDPVYRDTAPQACLASRVMVEEEPFGVLSFSSPAPRPRTFHGFHIDAMQLMAAWIGGEMRRRRLQQKLHQANAHWERLASLDPLTGLLNRRGLESELARRAQNDQEGRSQTALLIDLDDFKTINDRFDHAHGDEVLRTVAECIAGALRPEDLVARIGGDEFLVVAAGSLEQGAAVGERIRRDVQRIRIPFDDVVYAPTVSVGVSRIGKGVRSVGRLLTPTGPSLQRSKRQGKNRLAFDDDGEPQ